MTTPEAPLKSPDYLLEVGQPLLAHFAVGPSPTEQPAEFSTAINQLNPRFKEGRDLVRWQLEADDTKWPAATTDIIMDASRRMGLLHPETPLVGRFVLVNALGGARQAPLDRLRYAVDAANSRRAHYGQLVITGSSRVLPEAEQTGTANYAPGAVIEYDLCAAAAKQVAKDRPGAVAGPLFVDNPKAGNDEVIRAALTYAHEHELLAGDSHLAVVTTQIYQTSAALDLQRVAKEFDVYETLAAGNPSDPNIVAKRTPATYLSEVLRTLRAAVNALQAEN